MPWTMCCDPICPVAEVWCCSEHYLKLWVDFWWRFLGLTHRLQSIVIVQSLLRLLNLHKLVVGKLDLLRGGSYSVSWCVRPWIKFTPEYPCISFFFFETKYILWYDSYRQRKCVRRSPRLAPPCHPLLFSYSLRCHVKWRGRVACLFHTRSASPRLPVLHALLYETHKTSVHTARCNWRKPWSSTTEMSWLSRVVNSVAFSDIFLAMSLSRGYFSFLLRLWAVFAALVHLST